MNGLTTCDTSEMPVGQDLETTQSPKRARLSQPSYLASAPDNSAQSMPSGSSVQHLHSHQNRRNKNIAYPLDYGSEASSHESDEEDLAPPFFPRVGMSVYKTPEDPESDCVADDSALATDPAPAADPASGDFVSPELTDQPRSLYDFHWKAFPNPPIEPESRRERFSESNVGPNTPCVDPYDIFVAIWDRQFLEHIVFETNRYAQQMTTQMLDNHNMNPKSSIDEWRDTTVDELYTYFGIIIAMGNVSKSKKIEDYWSDVRDIFWTPGFSPHMSLNRFKLLSKCLHFNNNEDMCELQLDDHEAKIFKIQPVLSHLNLKFQSLYNLEQNICLDESLLQWNGRLALNYLVPNKAAEEGIKSYEICESRTGYLWRFEICAHKISSPKQSEDPINASTPAIVFRLTNGLENKGHTLWIDNNYNSPCLARRLKILGFDCVGTLRTNRKFIPQVLHNLDRGGISPGQVAGLTSGDVDIIVWISPVSHKVSMISTYHGNTVMHDQGSTKLNLMFDYNKMMGGVDKKDKILAEFPIEQQGIKVWYKILFRRLLNVSLFNSSIIHQGSVSSIYHRDFRTSLVESLLAKHSTGAMASPVTVRPHSS